MRDGREGLIVSGTRSVTRAEDGRPITITIEAIDEHGRQVHLAGSSQAWLAFFVNPRMFLWASLMEWTLDGVTVHGEDQDVFSLDVLRACRRSGFAAHPATGRDR